MRVAALQQDRARVPAHGPRRLGTEFIRAMRCHVFTLDDCGRTLDCNRLSALAREMLFRVSRRGKRPARSLVRFPPLAAARLL